MIGIILRVLAFIAFVIAAANGNVFSQGPADLVAWGLAFWVLATLIGGYGPAAPWGHQPDA